MNDIESAAYAANLRRAEPVAWPSELVNHPDPHEPDARIVGFRIRSGDPQFGYGLSEPLAWLRSVTIDRATPPASELVGALEDARRLDWLSKHPNAERMLFIEGNAPERSWHDLDALTYHPSLRAAIDAALALTNPKES